MAAHDIEVGCTIEPNKIQFHLKANVEALKYVAGIGVVSFGAIYCYPKVQPVILGVLQKVIGKVQNLVTGSLHFSIYCTDSRFLEILGDYESGRIKQRLEEEFLKVEIKTIELELEIENMTEIEERKEAIKLRYYRKNKC